MKSYTEQARDAVRWWRGLQPYFANGARNPQGDRAALARLRRADLLEAMQDPQTFTLFAALGKRRPDELPGIALCAAVLATVREDYPEHPARTLGPALNDPAERAAMKPLRFRRLIEADTPQARLEMLRRAVQLAKHRLNVRELALACVDWSERRRRDWIFHYYNAGFAAPTAEPVPEEAVV
ncbi:MAG TPA: type I-E CRISPR-associated protein Cse2/CasB [Candidatus Dormibacteraeota bacterium]|nr:type I-E CRISPR-associated protein Cse2/CasB [Candidatus Dormibacteraeota bacterium]